MLHVIVLGVIEEDSVVCGLANLRPPSGTDNKIVISERDGAGFTLLAHISATTGFQLDKMGQRATNLLIVSLKLLQDMLARIGVVNQGISL